MSEQLDAMTTAGTPRHRPTTPDHGLSPCICGDWHPVGFYIEATEAALGALREAARLQRNVLIEDEYGFEGKWVAIPRSDFDTLRLAAHADSEREGTR